MSSYRCVKIHPFVGGIIIQVSVINALMDRARRFYELKNLGGRQLYWMRGEWVYMKMKPEEITAIIKQQIQDYDVGLHR